MAYIDTIQCTLFFFVRGRCTLTVDVAELLVDGALANVRALARDLDHVRRLLLVELGHPLA